jgi:phage terminase small subunit
MAGQKKELTPKQVRFVEEYLVDLNGTQAAIRAGFSVRNAGRIAHQLLGKTRVAHAIRAAMRGRARRTQVTADNVLLELAKLAFSNALQFVEWDGAAVRLKNSRHLDRDAAACIAEVTQTPATGVKLKLHSKTQALEALAKHLGLYKDAGAEMLEVLLAKLPADLAREIRTALAAALSPPGPGEGGGPGSRPEV